MACSGGKFIKLSSTACQVTQLVLFLESGQHQLYQPGHRYFVDFNSILRGRAMDYHRCEELRLNAKSNVSKRPHWLWITLAVCPSLLNAIRILLRYPRSFFSFSIEVSLLLRMAVCHSANLAVTHSSLHVCSS
jgi:hypothetical protein